MSINPFAPSGDSVKFPDVGDEIALMVDAYKMLDDQFNPGQQVAVIEGRTPSGDSATLWCSKKGLVQAIGAAMREAGHDGTPEAGSVLKIKRVEDGVSQTAGFENPHRFVAQYTPPSQPAKAEAHAFSEPEAEAPVKVADPSDFFAS